MTGQNPVQIPGPTNMPDRLRNAMNIQTADHRALDFVDLLASLLADSKKVFKTEVGRVISFTSPAPEDGKLLSPVCSRRVTRFSSPGSARFPVAGSTSVGVTIWMSNSSNAIARRCPTDDGYEGKAETLVG